MCQKSCKFNGFCAHTFRLLFPKNFAKVFSFSAPICDLTRCAKPCKSYVLVLRLSGPRIKQDASVFMATERNWCSKYAHTHKHDVSRTFEHWTQRSTNRRKQKEWLLQSFWTLSRGEVTDRTLQKSSYFGCTDLLSHVCSVCRTFEKYVCSRLRLDMCSLGKKLCQDHLFVFGEIVTSLLLPDVKTCKINCVHICYLTFS